jgi:Coenzyme PQQ synthesis protein D (PqqD)
VTDTSHPHYIRRDLQGSRVGDDLVIFDDRVGKYFATGPVGADIWDMLATPLSMDAICEKLLAMYDIDAPTCRTQAEAFLKRMEAADLVGQK